MTLRRIFLVLSLVVTTSAWSVWNPAQSTPPPAATATARTTEDDATPTRRSFLVKATTTVAATTWSFLQITTSHPTAAIAATTPPLNQETALTQWKASVATIDNLLENWTTLSAGGGDAIRKELGTANFGTSISPLFQIEKVFKVLRDNGDVDLIEFTEKSEEFTETLVRADTMAYSSNFAGGSGKPTPPAVYLEKSRKEVVVLSDLAKSLSSLL